MELEDLNDNLSDEEKQQAKAKRRYKNSLLTFSETLRTYLFHKDWDSFFGILEQKDQSDLFNLTRLLINSEFDEEREICFILFAYIDMDRIDELMISHKDNIAEVLSGNINNKDLIIRNLCILGLDNLSGFIYSKYKISSLADYLFLDDRRELIKNILNKKQDEEQFKILEEKYISIFKVVLKDLGTQNPVSLLVQLRSLGEKTKKEKEKIIVGS